MSIIWNELPYFSYMVDIIKESTISHIHYSKNIIP